VLLTMGTWFRQIRRGHHRHRFYAASRTSTPSRRWPRARPRGCSLALCLRAAALRHRCQPVAFWPSWPPRRGSWASSTQCQARQRPLRATGNTGAPARQPAVLGMSLDTGGTSPTGFGPTSPEDVPPAQLRHRPGDRAARLRRRRRGRARVQARSWSRVYSAYPRRINFAKMREIADEVGATLMVDMAHFAGLVAGKVFTGDEDPVPHAHVTPRRRTSHSADRAAGWSWPPETRPLSTKGCRMVLAAH